MPALKATLGLDAGGFSAGLSKAQSDASAFASRYNAEMAKIRAIEYKQAAKLASTSHPGRQNYLAQELQDVAKLEQEKISIIAKSVAERTALEKKYNDYKLRQAAEFKSASEQKKLYGFSPTFTKPDEELTEEQLKKRYARRAARNTAPANLGGMSPGFAKMLVTETTIASEIAGEAGAKKLFGKYASVLQKIGGSGMSQLISVISNTASSLGSGIDPSRILLQQLPNLLQALTLMGDSAIAALKKFLFNPLTLGITAVVAAAAASAYMVYKYFHNLSLGLENVANKFGLAKITNESMVSSMRDGEKTIRAYKSWLDDVAKSTKTLAETTEKQIAKMRERGRLERELAQKKGASPKTITGMEVAEMEKELKILEEAAKLQKQRNFENKQAADFAASQLSPEKNAEKMTLLGYQEGERDKKAKALDMVRKKINYDKIEEYRNQIKLDPNAGFMESDTSSGSWAYKERWVNVAARLKEMEETVVKIEENGLKFSGTLKAAENELASATLREKQWKDAQEELTKALEERKRNLEQGITSEKTLNDRIDELQTQLGLKKEFGRAIAESSGKGSSPAVTERERIGLGTVNSIQYSMLDVNKKQLEELRMHRAFFDGINTRLEKGGF